MTDILRNPSSLILALLLFVVCGCATSPQIVSLDYETRLTDLRMQAMEHRMLNDGEESGGFMLGPGDSVSVKVWRNDELNGTVVVGPEGNIAIPLVGMLPVAGLSPKEVAVQLTKKLSLHLVDPLVSINIEKLANRKVFVLGEVQNPGALTLNPRMSMAEVIVTAGGFTADANSRRVLLARQGADAVNVSTLDMNPKSNSLALGFALPLKDRDMIYVPPSRIASIERFLAHFQNIVRPFSTLAGAIVLGDDAIDVLEGEERTSSVSLVP